MTTICTAVGSVLLSPWNIIGRIVGLYYVSLFKTGGQLHKNDDHTFKESCSITNSEVITRVKWSEEESYLG